jgi:hypothetical protein
VLCEKMFEFQHFWKLDNSSVQAAKVLW